MAVTAITMTLTPLMLLGYEKIIQPKLVSAKTEEKEPDTIEENNSVILVGFAHFGSTIGRFLRANGIHATIPDNDSDRVELLRKMGFKVYFGDATRVDLLESAGAEHAKIFVSAISSVETNFQIGEILKKHFPNLTFFVRAEDRFGAYELIEMGFLSPYYHYERKIANLSSLKKSGSDYSELSQEIAFEKKEVFDGLLDDLLKFKFKKCIVFTASIKHCKYVCEQLRAFGYQVAEVHSKNHKSDYQLFQFTHGDIKICVSVGILTKGYDFPDIDLIVLQRATISLPLYCQMIGRGSRIVDGKSHFTVLDYGGNASRLNLWNFEHDWSKKWNSAPKRKSEGVAPVKMCPKCGYMMPSVIMSCPGCGYVMEKAPPTPKETELIEVTAKYNTLRGRRIGTLTPKELAIYVKITNKKPFAKRIAMAKGQDFLEAYAKEVKWKYGWWNHIVADVSMPFTDVLIK
jgi:Trk K+ transport system NAD-binding subunit